MDTENNTVNIVKPFLSVVIPCWNCSKTIGRLLDSVINAGLPKEELQVIVCDDKSTDNFLDIVYDYEDRLDITYCETIRDFHCPGNTRQAALPYIQGEWFCFIDNDDIFEENAFTIVKSYIIEHDIQYTLCTNMREWDDNSKTYTRAITGEETDTWLHGKFFNTENTLNKFKCNFKEDLFSHEDVYFNSTNLGQLIGNDLDYVYLDIFTYKWVYRPDSLSRSYFSTDHYYIESYLGDYIYGACYPYFDMIEQYPDKKDWYVNQIMMTLLHSYFYYQASVWRLGHGALNENIVSIRELRNKITEKLGMNDFDIINYIYQNPQRYNNVKRGSIAGSCEFVEVQSFRDFILNL